MQALVLCGAGENLSAGADLQYVLHLIDEGRWQELTDYLVLFQTATSTMRYAPIPVAIAGRGLALGGGCEFSMSAAIRVMAAELRIGLVESKVGLIPGAGGCREIVRRSGAAVDAMFDVVRQGRMSDNAPQAQDWGLVESSDTIRMDGHRVIQYAVEEARALATDWSSPVPADCITGGAEGLQRLEALLSKEHSAGEMTAHDVVVASALARVLCGDGEECISESRLLELEREHFLRLCGMALTRDRIVHMLDTGKPLSN